MLPDCGNPIIRMRIVGDRVGIYPLRGLGRRLKHASGRRIFGLTRAYWRLSAVDVGARVGRSARHAKRSPPSRAHSNGFASAIVPDAADSLGIRIGLWAAPSGGCHCGGHVERPRQLTQAGP